MMGAMQAGQRMSWDRELPWNPGIRTVRRGIRTTITQSRAATFDVPAEGAGTGTGSWSGRRNACQTAGSRKGRRMRRAGRRETPVPAPLSSPIHTDWDDLIAMQPCGQRIHTDFGKMPQGGLDGSQPARHQEGGDPFAPSVDSQKKTTWPRYVLAVGTAPNKNLTRIAEALEGLPCRLLVLGRPDDADRLLLSCLTPGYKCCTGLREDEVALLYQMVAGSGGILLFPSLYEGFGRPILEAQSMGIPVITSRRDPMQEVAGAGAMLVDPTDTWEIREAVKRLLSDPCLYRRLQIRGLLNARRYSSETAARDYANIYREVGEE